jgi:glycosyltransferase involved in cell wall biosynthesis
MLSVLIPTYNYDVTELVYLLHDQLIRQKIQFEILCYDNGSEGKTNPVNDKINRLSHTIFKALKTDTGRSRVRNKLAEDSKYEYLLFLDADVIPVKDDFIKKYIQSIESGQGQVFYGGLKYVEEKPANDIRLRWIYGNKREAIPVNIRRNDTKIHFASGNFLINKNIFNKVKFDEDLLQYGYEDYLLAIELIEKGYQIIQTDNPVYHLGLDINEIFLEKTRKAVENLWELYQDQKIKPEYSTLLKMYKNISNFGLERFIRKILSPFLNKMEVHLISGKSSLWIYDLYKLGYLLSFIKEQSISDFGRSL